MVSVHRSVAEEDLTPRDLSGTNVNSNPDWRLLEELGSLAANGELIVPVERVYTLANALKALDSGQQSHSRGRSVVIMASADADRT